eukprot:3466994-Rhodomonas_salina.1
MCIRDRVGARRRPCGLVRRGRVGELLGERCPGNGVRERGVHEPEDSAEGVQTDAREASVSSTGVEFGDGRGRPRWGPGGGVRRRVSATTAVPRGVGQGQDIRSLLLLRAGQRTSVGRIALREPCPFRQSSLQCERGAGADDGGDRAAGGDSIVDGSGPG